MRLAQLDYRERHQQLMLILVFITDLPHFFKSSTHPELPHFP